MLIQKVTFSPVDNSKSIYKPNNKNTNSVSATTVLPYAKLDYSKIAFGSIYGVKPKKINLDAEKSKLLRQITELLQTEEQDIDTAEMTMKVMRRVMNFFREAMKRQEKILEEAEKLEKKMKKSELDLDDYLAQIRQMKKMGSFSSLLKLIPGMNQFKDIKIDDKEFGKIEAIICSMTPKEKRNTKLLNASRRIRIAKGSGTTVQDINKFIKSYEMTQKMMKQMKSKGGMKKFMNGIDENALKNFKI